MKYSKEQIDGLMELGYLSKDISQIEEAEDKCKFSVIRGNKEISITKNEAIDILGYTLYLSGLARSAFHSTSVRTGSNNRKVLFDSSALFRQGGAR